ncbi:hypothetical protein [Clostridium hydrogenum]|uniref:hypothetical protein n=1 Tax=Clostridium hydrogenum TaxID=2855764 RepID=UPI001F359850|nr:hypothetical protein [Clostridium hydrogenum]
MTTAQLITIIIILAVTAGVLATLLFIFPLLKKKGVDAGKALDNAQTAVNTAGKLIDAATAVLPSNPALNILEIVEKWAKIAVGDAEQLYHAGDITKDERAKTAETVVLNVLSELKIDVDDNKKALIDAAIKNAVNDLGHAK